jgi:hypothetical protein
LIAKKDIDMEYKNKKEDKNEEEKIEEEETEEEKIEEETIAEETVKPPEFIKSCEEYLLDITKRFSKLYYDSNLHTEV